MPLTIADLRGSPVPGGAQFITQVVPMQQADRAALVAAASALPKSPSMQTLLDKLAAADPLEDDYRVTIANALASLGALERALSELEQQVIPARITTQDDILVAKIGSITPTIQGVLDRFRRVAHELQAIEDGLVPLDQMRADVLAWAGDTGYTVPAAPTTP